MSLEDDYSRLRPDLERLDAEVRFGLTRALSSTRLKIHSVTSRVKALDSIEKKATTKGYEDPLQQSPDLVGARVVCLFLADLPSVKDAVYRTFQVLEDEDKVSGGPVSEFGYMSHHLVCRLGQDHSGPRYAELGEIRFEIQCRTILMDAWANVSHHLAYKGMASVPDDLQRDFAALSGLFFVADRQFEQLADAADQVQKDAVERLNDGEPLHSIRLDHANLGAWLSATFPNRKPADDNDVSALVEEVAALGFETIGQVNDQVVQWQNVAKVYEEEYPPGNAPTYASIGIVRVTLALAFTEYRATRGFSPNVDLFLEQHPELIDGRRD
ncbi:MAG TPA: hypothetical protein VK507_14470 [Iamia sp.]|nr:hypothetical protein [Iamia sp.]